MGPHCDLELGNGEPAIRPESNPCGIFLETSVGFSNAVWEFLESVSNSGQSKLNINPCRKPSQLFVPCWDTPVAVDLMCWYAGELEALLPWRGLLLVQQLRYNRCFLSLLGQRCLYWQLLVFAVLSPCVVFVAEAWGGLEMWNCTGVVWS